MSNQQTVHSESSEEPLSLARARDRVLFERVMRYRRQPTPANAAAILAQVGETIRGRANRYRPAPPLISRADIRQELILAVLDAALTMPLVDADYLERRLVLRAATRVSRALRREAGIQERLDDLAILDEDDEEEDNDDL